VVFATDRATARKTGDSYTRTYLALPNYHQNLERLGWPEADLQGAGSDRLFDSVVAWGDDETIANKLLEHRSAGADQVVVNVITPTPAVAPTAELRRLAPMLLR
jgi:probable F420-dependent oxidoreductase